MGSLLSTNHHWRSSAKHFKGKIQSGETALPTETETLVLLTTEIAAAYVSNNSVAASNVAVVIHNVFSTLKSLGQPTEALEEEKPKGAVSIRSSIKVDHILSMIDGKPYKTLKRHLAANGYTPESYCENFGLPKDYPMVAASYAEKRRELAYKIGLGSLGPKADVVAAKLTETPRSKRLSIKTGTSTSK